MAEEEDARLLLKLKINSDESDWANEVQEREITVKDSDICSRRMTERNLESRPYGIFRKKANIVILGKKGVGKTSIFEKIQKYIKTNCPAATKRRANQVGVKNDDVHIMVSDVNLPDIQNRGCPFSVCKADVVVLVYSVDDLDSFEYIESLKDYFISRKGHEFPIIVIGNKTDFSKRAMPYNIVDCLVTIDWELTYVELSALDKNSVAKTFGTFFTQTNKKLLLTIGKHLGLFEADRKRFENDLRLQKFQSTTDEKPLLTSDVKRKHSVVHSMRQRFKPL